MIREIDVLTGVETSRTLTADEQAKADANTAEEIANAPAPYIAKRREEYPPIGDQLDALYHKGVFPDEMAKKIKAVKDKYPKNQ
tara:strand:+ start:590 stop:841 length:252 start_codon:yes stop_codon:yes gene_type:complete